MPQALVEVLVMVLSDKGHTNFVVEAREYTRSARRKEAK